ncbi:adenylate/guanylate cyclase domain-containing protein, partial [Mycobacterium kansasii]|uniref:adenylate/guanylate cyclase domain-containing protein n=1 Tax=Mycobacterium kansasii TaxID=1768 RepID=UPI001F3C340E
ARATVEVLHALIERVGNQGVHTYADLRSYLPNVTQAQRRKRVLAAGLPNRPGIYVFRGPSGEVLYVGTAVDLRRRVSQYFNGADPRGRIKEMVALATGVDHVECAHPLEAGVRELRMLAAHAPPYNRRSRFPHRRLVQAAVDLVEHPRAREAELQVRAGLAYGTVLAINGDYFGNPVNLAARLVAVASPRQILAASELHNRLPDWPATAHGPLTLKGFDAPVTAFELHAR